MEWADVLKMNCGSAVPPSWNSWIHITSSVPPLAYTSFPCSNRTSWTFKIHLLYIICWRVQWPIKLPWFGISEICARAPSPIKEGSFFFESPLGWSYNQSHSVFVWIQHQTSVHMYMNVLAPPHPPQQSPTRFCRPVKDPYVFFVILHIYIYYIIFYNYIYNSAYI